MLKLHSPAILFKICVKLWNNWQAQWSVSTLSSAWNYFSIDTKKPKANTPIFFFFSPHASPKIREGKKSSIYLAAHHFIKPVKIKGQVIYPQNTASIHVRTLILVTTNTFLFHMFNNKVCIKNTYIKHKLRAIGISMCE